MNIDNFWSVLERKHQLDSMRQQISDHERQIKELKLSMNRDNND